MRRRVILSLAALVLLTTGVAPAQSSSATTFSDRKIASRVSPAYPELAKKMHIHGVVRVEATVKPNGSVKTTCVLGGNPVLVDAALDAVASGSLKQPRTRPLKSCNSASTASENLFQVVAVPKLTVLE